MEELHQIKGDMIRMEHKIDSVKKDMQDISKKMDKIIDPESGLYHRISKLEHKVSSYDSSFKKLWGVVSAVLISVVSYFITAFIK